MTLQTFVLAAGLLAADPTSHEDTPKGEAAPGWIIELNGYIPHKNAAPKAVLLIVEFKWPQPQPPLKIDPVEARYYDDLRPFWEQLKKQRP